MFRNAVKIGRFAIRRWVMKFRYLESASDVKNKQCIKWPDPVVPYESTICLKRNAGTGNGFGEHGGPGRACRKQQCGEVDCDWLLGDAAPQPQTNLRDVPSAYSTVTRLPESKPQVLFHPDLRDTEQNPAVPHS